MRPTFALLVALCGLLSFDPARAEEKHPNIVMILADDLGNGDLGYRGGQVKTPNIDKLATESVRLESFYGMPVCTPSRAALVTGRYPMRYGLQTLVIFPSHTYGLPTDERTLPQALREAGYYTTLIADDAVKLIDQQDGKTPFFLYFASLAPHAPYQVPQKYKDLYPGIKDKNRQAYAGMISALDEDVGRIVAALEKKKLLDNTIILFASDNGGATSALFATGARSEEQRRESGGVGLGEKPPASNAPFRGGKGSLYEGGVRVPAFVSWPGHLQPRVVNDALHMVDVMPTLLSLSGGKGSPDHPMDGKDMWPTLAGGKPSPNEDVLINVEAFRGAVRKGDWKLVKIALLPGKTELFDLAKDPGETTNVAGEHPDVLSDLESRLLAYAKQQKPSLWIKAQPAFAGAQGKTILDPDFDIDDGGLPHEKPAVPRG